MKRFETYLFITALLLVIFTSRQVAVAETRNVQVKILNDIVLCNSTEKTFDFLIDIGKVVKADSFVGYDLWMKYDPKLVRIISMLPMNSFTELCPQIYRGFALGKDKDNNLDGTFRAFGMVTGNTLLYGERHLVAFKAIYVGPDSVGMSSPIEFQYIDFLDASSFRGQEIVYSSSDINVIPGDVSKNKFSIVSNDEFKLNEAKSCAVNVGYKLENTKQLENLSFIIENPNPDLFTVTLAENQENSDLEILSIESVIQDQKSIMNVKARMKEFSTNTLFNLNVELKNTITDSVEIKIIPTIDDNCDCVGSVEDKSFKIINIIPQVSVNETKENDYTIAEDAIYLNDPQKVKEIIVFDMNGRIVKEITITNEKLISLNEIYNGIYFVKTKLIDDKFEIKKIIINK
ncbi:MAG: T9SS type A sorting domain-containing protein [bacterium]